MFACMKPFLEKILSAIIGQRVEEMIDQRLEEISKTSEQIRAEKCEEIGTLVKRCALQDIFLQRYRKRHPDHNTWSPLY